ncbi:hypothetical protein HYFRA_00012727 [Hymenoscyphus fraxineus]|uniref:Uncharacterized protein n=1 Tax=Hymenoscyphus fraxineus TaxID=746836 RepID=A0A9N9L910_9HELO|nr:hypothetical protein HYFRA_00012727 [Hymenoscyphus fraxineus]
MYPPFSFPTPSLRTRKGLGLTEARKFELVHKNTVASKSAIPNVLLATFSKPTLFLNPPLLLSFNDDRAVEDIDLRCGRSFRTSNLSSGPTVMEDAGSDTEVL